MRYYIEHLPMTIPMGVQSENNAEAVEFDVSDWLARDGSLSFSVWVTRPGETEAYQAANATLKDGILYWWPTGADTAIAGEGRVEILAVSANRRMLSGWTATSIRETTTETTTDAPVDQRPWLDQALLASEEAKAAATSAAASADRAEGVVKKEIAALAEDIGTVFAETGALSSYLFEQEYKRIGALQAGGVEESTGGNLTGAAMARTNYLSINGNTLCAKLGLPDYEWMSWSYSDVDQHTATHKNSGWVSGDMPIFAACHPDDAYIRLAFRRVDGQALTTDTDDAASDWSVILANFTLYSYGVEKVSEIEERVTVLEDAEEATKETLLRVASDASVQTSRLVQWRRGGLYASGKIYVDQSKNRMVSTLVSLRKGDVISSADGYALAVNFYSHYTSDDDFEMITNQTMTEEPIVVPADCVAFIGAKKTDNAAFTADDILMGNSFVHIPDQHKGVSEMLTKGAEENAFRNIADIPVDALAYYDKWEQEIPTSKYAYSRELLCYADSTVNYPVYLYRFDLYNNWIDNNYAYNNYTPEKGNALYRKPRILVTSGIHGNERATPVAVMVFAKNLLENPAYAHLLGQYDWFFVPLVNPWGFSHSVINDSTGEVVYNNYPSWTNDTLPDGYTIIENTITQCGGIRRNAGSMDINRDFSDVQYVYNTNTYGFATPEAQAIKVAAQTYGFDMAFDLHQSFDASTADNAPKCGYVRMQYAPRSGEPAAERVAFYREASAVNSKVDNYFREMYGNGVSKPMSLIWNGGTNPSIMNYFGGYEAYDGTGNSANKDLACAYSFCVETSQVCYPLSQYENGWYNSVANHYTNVYCAELMRKLSELN